MKEFEKKLSDADCKEWFRKLFGGIWNQEKLEEIIFLNEAEKNEYYKDLSERNNEQKVKESHLVSLAGFLGDSFWAVFSNNHSVYLIDEEIEFDIGSFRGSGSFIAEFLESENSELQFSYIDFYMGHFGESNGTGKSYEYIFKRLNENGFDWFYAYPELGIVDFTRPENDKPKEYNPNKSVEDEINKQCFLKIIDEINEETFNKIQNSPLSGIIKAYIKVFNKYPEGWIEN